MKYSLLLLFALSFLSVSAQQYSFEQIPEKKSNEYKEMVYSYTLQTELPENIIWERLAKKLHSLSSTGSLRTFDPKTNKEMDSSAYKQSLRYKNKYSRDTWESENMLGDYEEHPAMATTCLDLKINYLVFFDKKKILMKPAGITLLLRSLEKDQYEDTFIAYYVIADIIQKLNKDDFLKWVNPLNNDRQLTLEQLINGQCFKSKNLNIVNKYFNVPLRIVYDSIVYHPLEMLFVKNKNSLEPVKTQIKINNLFYGKGDSCQSAVLAVMYRLDNVKPIEERDSLYEVKLSTFNTTLNWMQWGIRENKIPVFYFRDNSLVPYQKPEDHSNNAEYEYVPSGYKDLSLLFSFTYNYGKKGIQLSEINNIYFSSIYNNEGSDSYYIRYKDLEKYILESNRYEGAEHLAELKDIFYFHGQIQTFKDKNGSLFYPDQEFDPENDFITPNYINDFMNEWYSKRDW